MSEVMQLVANNDAVKCGDCQWTGKGEDLAVMLEFEGRVSAGEIVPAGECPKCGALAHLAKRPRWRRGGLDAGARHVRRAGADAVGR